MDGKNIADFIDLDILEKLDALEREEETLEAQGFYDSEDNMVSISVVNLLQNHINACFSSIQTTNGRRQKQKWDASTSCARRAPRSQ